MNAAPPMPRPPKTDPAQFEYDGLFEYGQSKQNLTVQEVAKGLGIGDKQVLALLDEGYLYAAPINDRLDPNPTLNPTPNQPALRLHRRIARFSVLAFYYERCSAEGQPIPFRQTPQITWWRNELRTRRGLPPLTEGATSPNR